MGYHLFIERLDQLIKRIQGYPQREVFVELAVIWIAVYVVLRYLRGTRGARAIKGMAMILIVATLLGKVLASDNSFERLNYLYGYFLVFALVAMMIVFQPEIRRAMVRLGEARLIFGPGLRRSRVVEEVVGAVGYLSKNKIGALIALERHVGLKGIVEGGTTLDSEVSKELLNTIFWPGSALHDMGVVIQGDRLVMAGVQFPLAEGDQFGTELGSRHRAAIGLSQEADALVVVVSEETGTISLAQRGKLTRHLTPDQLKDRLIRTFGRSALTANGDTEPETPNGAAT